MATKEQFSEPEKKIPCLTAKCPSGKVYIKKEEKLKTASPKARPCTRTTKSIHYPKRDKNRPVMIVTVFFGENVIPIAKMHSSVATNLCYFSILFYNKSQKWKILATLGLF